MTPARTLPDCGICGEPLRPERRRPGRKFADLSRERRNLFATGPEPPPRPMVQP